MYPSIELLIVADGEDVRDLVPRDPRIRLIHFDGPFGSIGEKRNIGCALARGHIVCHWDDDDFSGPDRVIDQIARIEDSGRAVSGYHSMRFTDGVRWWKYEGTRNYALGTSLCYRKAWWETHPFPALMIGEDNGFVETAHREGQLDTTDAADRMYATNHAGNTSPRMMGDNWKAMD